MAGIVHFVNPDPGEEGHFHWHWQRPDDPVTFENWLDITRPSTDQFGLATPNSVGQLYEDDGGDSRNITFGGAGVALVEGTTITRAFEFGQDIVGAPYNHRAAHWFTAGGPLESDFPDGELRYIGVLTGGGNYGWIAVIRENRDLRALAWAYETVPGRTIHAGEVPGLGGVPLFGLLGLAARRRRRE